MKKTPLEKGAKVVITKGSMAGRHGRVLHACREGYFVEHEAGSTTYQRDEIELASQAETQARSNPGQVS